MGSYDQYRPQQMPDDDDVLWVAQEQSMQERIDAAEARTQQLNRREKAALLGGFAIVAIAFFTGVALGKRREGSP